MTSTRIPHPIIPSLNQYPLNIDTKKQILQQAQKLSLSSETMKKNAVIKGGKSNIPVRISTLRRVYSEPTNIHQGNIAKLPALSRASSEPHNLHVTCKSRARAQPNYQISQVARSPAEIQKAKDEKIAAYQSLSDACKCFLNEKLSFKILTTFKKERSGKEVKKFIVAYEDFKQGVNTAEKEKYQQIKQNGFSPENRFQFTKTVWVELEKIKVIQTQEALEKMVNNTKWSHLNR